MAKISLKAIDVGFDPRVLSIDVVIPSDIGSVEYDDLVEPPRSKTATGSPEEIAKELHSAGFNVVVKK